MKTFLLPDLGEGLAEAEITEWNVQVGDMVKVDQPLLSVETAKAVVDVPSPYTGKILKLYGAKGDMMETGKPLVDFEVDGVERDTGTVVGNVEVGEKVVSEEAVVVAASGSGVSVKATPAVRALAKKLGVDLALVIPSGPDNTVTLQDVQKAASASEAAGPIELLRGVRRQMAITMQKSHAEVVPVTIFDDANIASWGKEKDYSVRLIQAITHAAQKEPALNAWYDSGKMGRRIFKEVHLGVAVDTEDGLFVPVIRDAQSKSTVALREMLEAIKQKIQTRTVTPQELQGQTIILSNFGKFAGRYASPIVVPPMVAILAVGRVRDNWLPLSLSFDHRAVTGGEASRFLGYVIESLQG